MRLSLLPTSLSLLDSVWTIHYILCSNFLVPKVSIFHILYKHLKKIKYSIMININGPGPLNITYNFLILLMHLYYLWHSSKLGTIASFITEYIIHHILDIILKCILPGQQPFSERLIGHNEILVGTFPALGIQIHKI